jgi:hypothetical protein
MSCTSIQESQCNLCFNNSAYLYLVKLNLQQFQHFEICKLVLKVHVSIFSTSQITDVPVKLRRLFLERIETLGSVCRLFVVNHVAYMNNIDH